MPQWARGQADQRVHRLGWLSATELQRKEPYGLAFVQRLRELGFLDGGNLTIEYRHSDSRIEMLPSAAAELARLNVDIFFRRRAGSIARRFKAGRSEQADSLRGHRL